MPRCLFLFLLSVLSFPPFGFAQCYEITRIEVDGGLIGGNDLNDLGHVAGSFAECLFCRSDASIWRGPDEPIWVMPSPPGSDSATSYSINNSGGIAGQFRKGGIGGESRAYTYQNGQYIDLPPAHPGEEAMSLAWSMNEQGIVCGWRTHVDGPSPRKAFIWSAKGGFTDLKLPRGPHSEAIDINNYGAVTGLMGEGPTRTMSAFLWDNTKVINLGPIPNGISSKANGINNLDPPEIVGDGLLNTSSSSTRPFYYRAGVMKILPKLPGYTRASSLDISDSGTIVGFARITGKNIERACIWRDHLIVDLNDLISSEANIRLEGAIAINQSGQILVRSVDLEDRLRRISVLLTPSNNLGDLNCDGTVNVNDLIKLIGDWGPCPEGMWSISDLDSNRQVNVYDLLILLDNWDFLSATMPKSERR